ncbi:MAG TPA: hypothetical protein VG817_04555, partial [Gemmatimonadales bacterium]|nr:hypothetical protein [Gemmatimonadales bacterium]
RAKDDVSPADAPRSYVAVVNNFALPVEITITGGGTTIRLGTVHPGMSATYVLPPVMVNAGSTVFSANPGNRSVYHSGELLIASGAVVDMNVASVLFNSTVTIRP